MKKYYYLHKEEIFELEASLPPGYAVSQNVEDQETHYVLISNAEAERHLREESPDASVELTAEQRREQEYERRIPRHLLDAYISYLAEGKTDEADTIARQIAEIKQEIRLEIPD